MEIADVKRVFAEGSKGVRRAVQRPNILAHVGVKCPVCGEKYSPRERYEGNHICSVG